MKKEPEKPAIGFNEALQRIATFRVGKPPKSKPAQTKKNKKSDAASLKTTDTKSEQK